MIALFFGLQRPQIARFRPDGRAPGSCPAISNPYTSKAPSSAIEAGVLPPMVTNIWLSTSKYHYLRRGPITPSLLVHFFLSRLRLWAPVRIANNMLTSRPDTRSIGWRSTRTFLAHREENEMFWFTFPYILCIYTYIVPLLHIYILFFWVGAFVEECL